MVCQIPFSRKNEKNIINFSSAAFAQRVVNVKYFDILKACWLKNFIKNFKYFIIFSFRIHGLAFHSNCLPRLSE